MNLMDLKSDIIKKQLRNFYIFTGDEVGIMYIYINQISKVKSLDIVRVDTVHDAWAAASTKGMFASEPAIYVVRGDKDFQKEEKHWDSVVNGLTDSMIILLYDKADSRLKFWKHFKDDVIQVEKLDTPVLVKYIMQKLPGVSSTRAETLANVCGGSYDVCMLECEKILTFQNSTEDRDGWKSVTNNCVDKLIADGTISQSQETDVFQFVDAVCKRRIAESVLLASQLRFDGVSSITTLGTLYSSLKAILLIQCCTGSDIANITGLDNGTIYYNKKRTGFYSSGELVTAVRLISRVIEDIKIGKIEDEFATDYVLVKIL
jgi:DNA polymerase III delta subunit